VRIGRDGSRDRLIARTGEGIYFSLFLFGTHRVWFAFGPRYINRAGIS